MNKWVSSVLVIMLSSAVTQAIQANTTPMPQKSTATNAEKSYLKHVPVSQDGIVRFTLSSNPGSTGYSWQYIPTGSNDVKLLPSQIKQSAQEAKTLHGYRAPLNKNLMGASGTQTFTFQLSAKAMQQKQPITLHMLKIQPWMQNANGTPKAGASFDTLTVVADPAHHNL